MTYEGVLPISKPAGFTSHDVVAKMRRILGMKRIGHTGTLDPQVTGVLPLCLGKATRMVEYIQELPKEYEAELTIGYATDTEDWTGETTDSVDPGTVSLTEDAVIQALSSFRGTIEQIPPMYSAVKIGGKKLYELAREGKEVERKSRLVVIHEIELLRFQNDGGYPKASFRTVCSKGTYIRTLCADLGKALGYPAVMTGLVRTSTGLIGLDKCLSIEDVERLQREGQLQSYLIPSDQAVAHLPSFTIPAREAAHAVQGKRVSAASADKRPDVADGLVRLYGPEGSFLGIFRTDSTAETFLPEKVFGMQGGE